MNLGTAIFLQLLEENPLFYTSRYGFLEIQDFVMPNNLDKNHSFIINKYQDLLKDYKGTLSFHAPFKELFPSSWDNLVQDLARKRFSQALKYGKELGCTTMVVHSCFNPLIRDGSYRDAWFENSKIFWDSFLNKCVKEGIKVVMENVWDEDCSHIIELLDEFSSPFFKACLDTGHARLSSRYSLEEWGSMLGKNLAHVHIHDNHGFIDEHLPVGQGTIVFDSFLRLINNNSSLTLINEAYGSIKEEEIFLNYLNKFNLGAYLGK